METVLTYHCPSLTISGSEMCEDWYSLERVSQLKDATTLLCRDYQDTKNLLSKDYTDANDLFSADYKDCNTLLPKDRHSSSDSSSHAVDELKCHWKGLSPASCQVKKKRGRPRKSLNVATEHANIKLETEKMIKQDEVYWMPTTTKHDMIREVKTDWIPAEAEKEKREDELKEIYFVSEKVNATKGGEGRKTPSMMGKGSAIDKKTTDCYGHKEKLAVPTLVNKKTKRKVPKIIVRDSYKKKSKQKKNKGNKVTANTSLVGIAPDPFSSGLMIGKPFDHFIPYDTTQVPFLTALGYGIPSSFHSSVNSSGFTGVKLNSERNLPPVAFDDSAYKLPESCLDDSKTGLSGISASKNAAENSASFPDKLSPKRKFQDFSFDVAQYDESSKWQKLQHCSLLDCYQSTGNLNVSNSKQVIVA